MRKMKDSGIEWIGEIPEEWKVPKIKYVAKFFNGDRGKNYPSGNDLVDEGIIFLTSNNIHGVELDCSPDISKYISEQRYKLLGGAKIKINDIIYCLRGSIGNSSINLSQNHGTIASSLVDIRPKNIVPKFLNYFLKSDVNYIQTQKYSTGSCAANLSAEDVSNYFLIEPPIQQQQQIADFLDARCSEIDATAEDIQKEINILEDYKKSLIYNAISNGITNKEYSEKHDEVWGNIPKGWKLVDIKYLFEIVKRIAGKEGYDVLSVTQKGLKIKDITSGDGQLADNYSGYQFVYPTDYVMNHMDLLTGWVDCSELFGVTSPDYRVFRLRDKSVNNLTFYKYVMQCCYMNKIFYSLGQGVSNLGRWRLQTSSFNNFKVPVPPKAEQQEIAAYLDARCAEIDALIEDKKKQLDLLAEYKKSLIYEYVTGKKEAPAQE